MMYFYELLTTIFTFLPIPKYCFGCGGKIEKGGRGTRVANPFTGKPLREEIVYKCANYSHVDYHFFVSRNEFVRKNA